MKIEVEGEKIVQAVKKSSGIEIVLETADDAREAIDLILSKSDFFRKDSRLLKDMKVTAFQRYETSAVNYKKVYLLDFIFRDEVALDDRVEAVREFQEYLEKPQTPLRRPAS